MNCRWNLSLNQARCEVCEQMKRHFNMGNKYKISMTNCRSNVLTFVLQGRQPRHCKCKWHVKQHIEESISKANTRIQTLFQLRPTVLTETCKKRERGYHRHSTALAPNRHISNWRQRGGQRGEREGRAALPAWGVWHVPSPGLLQTWGQSK